MGEKVPIETRLERTRKENRWIQTVIQRMNFRLVIRMFQLAQSYGKQVEAW